MQMGCQIYVKGSVEAVALYEKAFGAALGYHVRNEDGTFFHAELSVEGSPMLAVSEAGSDIGAELLARYSPELYPTMNFGVTLSSPEAVRQAYEALQEGGKVLLALGKLPWCDLCANVIDRFGVFWYVSVTQHKPEEG